MTHKTHYLWCSCEEQGMNDDTITAVRDETTCEKCLAELKRMDELNEKCNQLIRANVLRPPADVTKKNKKPRG